jgi:sucrose-6-phosphate hydrolase SacC (GH32 family)
MRNLIVPSLFSLLTFSSFSQAPVVQFSFEENTGDLTTLDSVSMTTLSIANHFQKPERIEAPQGKALRLDGYSTWASSTNFTIPNVTKKMAVEIWYATEAFNEQSAGLVSQISGSQGFTIKVTPYGNIFAQFFADGQTYFFSTIQTLEKYRWNHLFFQVDLDEKKAQIFVNGELWSTKQIGQHNQLAFSNSTFYLGRGNDSPLFGQFLLSASNGALDEVNIFNQTFTPSEIAARFEEVGLVETELEIKPALRHEGDHLRPQYHVMPNTSWTNESYGLTYYQGKYHLFSQKNPNSPTLYFMHWGHYSSPDLVSWKEERIALAPKPGFSDFGIWSGTTVLDENGTPVIAYTGVDGQKAGIGMAFPLDTNLIEWEVAPQNPVIPSPPAGYAHMDFRDPYIWKEGSTYYMVVGSGLQNNGGGILFSYKSTDLLNWTSILPIYQNSNYVVGGRFWEMPAMLKFDNGDYALVVTPLFVGKPAETVYWLGTFSNDKFSPYQNEPKKFEHLTRHLLSPSFGYDEEGRLTYLGIVPEDRDVNDQIAAGWRQTFSLPRVARLLEEGRIGHYPHPNLCRLRLDSVHIENRTISSGTNFNLPEIEGNQYEIDAVLIPEPNTKFSLQLLKNAAASLFTSVDFDLTINRLGLNRLLSSPYSTTENNRFDEYVFGDTVRLRVFVDHSIVEVFVDNLAVISTRVYPGEDQRLVDFVVPQGSVKIERLDFYELGAKEGSYPTKTCPPDDLPGAFYSGIFDLSSIDVELSAYPNPVVDFLTIQTPEELIPPFEAKIYSADGQQCLQKNIAHTTDSLNVKELLPGLYYLQLTDGKKTGVVPFYKH